MNVRLKLLAAMKVTSTSAAILLAAVLCWSPAASIFAEDAAGNAVGWIPEVAGVWMVNGKVVELGQSIRAGSTITLGEKADRKDAKIIVSLFDGSVQAWPQEKASEPRIELPKAVAKETKMSLLEAVAALFQKHPERYVATISRAGSAGRVRETVVALEGGRGDLAPMMQEVPAGDYALRFRALKEDANAPSLKKSVAYQWKPGAESTRIDAPPGLYKVSVLDAKTAEPLGLDAWVLLAAPEAAKKAAASFREAQAVAQRYEKAGGAEAGRSFLRASLESLAPDALK